MRAVSLFERAILVLLVVFRIFIVVNNHLIVHITHPQKAATLILSFHPCAISEFIGSYLHGPLIGTTYWIVGTGIRSLLSFKLARR